MFAAVSVYFFFFNDTATTEIYTLSLHDALPISDPGRRRQGLLPPVVTKLPVLRTSGRRVPGQRAHCSLCRGSVAPEVWVERVIRPWHPRCSSWATRPRGAWDSDREEAAMTELRVTRRQFLTRTVGAAATVSTLGVPAIVRSQPKELVIGGAASHKAFMEPTVIPMFEKKYGCKIIFEGTKSLVNLEKMVSNKTKPYLSVVMMDDPVLLLAAKEDVSEKITPAKVANMAKLKAAAIHMGGMWTDYQQPFATIAHATAKLKTPPASWTELWDPKYKGKLIVPSL